MRLLPILILATTLLFSLTGCKTTAPLDAYQGYTDQQIFQRGEKNMQKKNYEAAVKDFEALDALYPFGQYSQQGQREIITAYYESGDNDAALAAADRYIRLYPRSNDVDSAYYLKGIINTGPSLSWVTKWMYADPVTRDVSAEKAAFQDFTTLVERFPNSKYAPEARKRMAELRNLIAQHDLNIAQYYLERKTYVAAVNRATDLLKNYPGTPQIPAALSIIVQGYRALNEPDSANAAQNILLTKYPNSIEAKKLAGKK